MRSCGLSTGLAKGDRVFATLRNPSALTDLLARVVLARLWRSSVRTKAVPLTQPAMALDLLVQLAAMSMALVEEDVASFPAQSLNYHQAQLQVVASHSLEQAKAQTAKVYPKPPSRIRRSAKRRKPKKPQSEKAKWRSRAWRTYPKALEA